MKDVFKIDPLPVRGYQIEYTPNTKPYEPTYRSKLWTNYNNASQGIQIQYPSKQKFLHRAILTLTRFSAANTLCQLI